MAVLPNIKRRFDPRAFLVITALISLCVSINVGPRFLPLPKVTDGAAEEPQENQRDQASRHPTPVASDSFRVPMMAQTQKRADKEPEPQPFATTLKDSFVLPNDARDVTEFSYSIPLLISPSVSQPSGRAPPRLA
jgi:hypothetical protein